MGKSLSGQTRNRTRYPAKITKTGIRPAWDRLFFRSPAEAGPLNKGGRSGLVCRGINGTVCQGIK